MELAHRAPKAIASEWIAESALRYLRGTEKRDAAEVTKQARAAAESWPSTSAARLDAIAAHAAHLAPLDVVHRSNGHAMPLPVTDAEHAELTAEVRALLGVAEPLWALASAKPLVLNPVLGSMGLGADADVIAGDLVLDIKTTGDAVIERDQMRQAAAYACLAAYDPNSRFRSIKRVGVYLSRQGTLRTLRLVGDEMDRAGTGLFLHETWTDTKLAFEDAGDAIRAAIATLETAGEQRPAERTPRSTRRR